MDAETDLFPGRHVVACVLRPVNNLHFHSLTLGDTAKLVGGGGQVHLAGVDAGRQDHANAVEHAVLAGLNDDVQRYLVELVGAPLQDVRVALGVHNVRTGSQLAGQDHTQQVYHVAALRGRGGVREGRVGAHRDSLVEQAKHLIVFGDRVGDSHTFLGAVKRREAADLDLFIVHRARDVDREGGYEDTLDVGFHHRRIAARTNGHSRKLRNVEVIHTVTLMTSRNWRVGVSTNLCRSPCRSDCIFTREYRGSPCLYDFA